MKLTGIALLVAILSGAGCSSNSTTPGGGGGANGSGGNGGSTGSGGAGGGGGMITSCSVPSSFCVEYSADYTGSREAGCNVLHGTYATAPCDHAGSSGGCRQPAGATGTQTTYYYPPIMPADVMVQCMNDGNATYVAP